MAKQEIKIKALGKYNGHSFKANGIVELKLKFEYDELVNYYMQLPLLRSENTSVLVKLEEEVANLGIFMLKAFHMDHDGEGTITFNSMHSSVEPNNLNMLVVEKDKLFKFMFKATVEPDEDENVG